MEGGIRGEEIRFYSTYEELKQVRIQDIFNISLSFYSTYEELKRNGPLKIEIEEKKFLQYL